MTQHELKELTEDEKAIIMGTLLGDGHLHRRKSGNCRLKVEHGLKQKDLVFWKYEMLKRLCPTTSVPKEQTNKKGETTWLFYTSTGPLLREIHELFYQLDKDRTNREQNRGKTTQYYKKTITPKLLENLPKNPFVLAVWYMDDGSIRNDTYSGKIASQSFSLDENKLLTEYLSKTWGLNCQVVKHTTKSGQYYISIPAKGDTFREFIKIIEGIVSKVEIMKYKLNEGRSPSSPRQN